MDYEGGKKLSKTNHFILSLSLHMMPCKGLHFLWLMIFLQLPSFPSLDSRAKQLNVDHVSSWNKRRAVLGGIDPTRKWCLEFCCATSGTSIPTPLRRQCFGWRHVTSFIRSILSPFRFSSKFTDIELFISSHYTRLVLCFARFPTTDSMIKTTLQVGY